MIVRTAYRPALRRRPNGSLTALLPAGPSAVRPNGSLPALLPAGPPQCARGSSEGSVPAGWGESRYSAVREPLQRRQRAVAVHTQHRGGVELRVLWRNGGVP